MARRLRSNDWVVDRVHLRATALGDEDAKPLASLALSARERSNQEHYPVIRENRGERGFILWGYNAGPRQMAESGRELFVNVADSLR